MGRKNMPVTLKLSIHPRQGSGKNHTPLASALAGSAALCQRALAGCDTYLNSATVCQGSRTRDTRARSNRFQTQGIKMRQENLRVPKEPASTVNNQTLPNLCLKNCVSTKLGAAEAQFSLYGLCLLLHVERDLFLSYCFMRNHPHYSPVPL